MMGNLGIISTASKPNRVRCADQSTGINESAFGIGYEGRLRTEVYQRRGIHPLAGERILPNEINIAPPAMN